MVTVFVDVDDTLVLYDSPAALHPYGIINGKPYRPNTSLIEKLKKVDGRIVVWSGGGRDYARKVAREVLLPEGIRCRLASKFEDFGQIKPGDIVVDDQKEYFTTMEEFGVNVFGPLEDWNLKETLT